MKIKKIFCEKSNLTQRQTSFNSLYYILYCIKKQLFPNEKQDLSQITTSFIKVFHKVLIDRKSAILLVLTFGTKKNSSQSGKSFLALVN